MAYQTTPYQNSVAYNSVMAATTRDQLLNRKNYTNMAIEYHTQAGNADQVEFFKSDLELIEKRLAMLSRSA